jgi:CheY-like chemotaxis protein
VSDLLVLVDNLFFQARIQATAARVGLPVRVVHTGADLIRQVHEAAPSLIIVDLTARDQPLEAIRQIKQSGCPAPVLGYLPHTLTELAEQAAAAGCDRVLAQGPFTQQLPALLAEAAGRVRREGAAEATGEGWEGS